MSEGPREDCSRSLRIRAEEKGRSSEEGRLGFGSGKRKLGKDSLLGSFCFLLKDTLISACQHSPESLRWQLTGYLSCALESHSPREPALDHGPRRGHLDHWIHWTLH